MHLTVILGFLQNNYYVQRENLKDLKDLKILNKCNCSLWLCSPCGQQDLENLLVLEEATSEEKNQSK